MKTYSDSTLSGLLGWITDCPYDDAPRLAFADRLRELGHGADADFVARQLASPSERVRLTWRGPENRGCPVVIRRGFEECITVPPDYLFRHARDIFSALPLTRVVLFGLSPRWGAYWMKPPRGRPAEWPEEIPHGLWPLLEGPEGDEGGETCRSYRNEAHAMRDASNAAVRYGRKAAGLGGLGLATVRENARQEFSSAR